MTQPFVFGLGSHHGDDQAGWLVVDLLQARGYPSNRLARLRHPADLLDWIDRADSVVICDACAGRDDVGAIRRMHWIHGCLIPYVDQIDTLTMDNYQSVKVHSLTQFHIRSRLVEDEAGIGSHDVQLTEILKLGEVLGRLPESIDLWTIQGIAWEPEAQMSEAVRSAAADVANAMWIEFCDA